MDLNKVEILPPFKNFFATVGNIPSSYQESMTYYEMLQWFCNYLENTVIPALNNNGQSVIELQNLFVQLHDYVENYFNNLDVQEEINNKLDTMASDGTLDQLLLPYFNQYKNEINADMTNYKNNINHNIDAMNTKIDAQTSGSPLVASSTSEMTDRTRIYVNTTDGNWYYYNGTSWVSGGTYQSIQNSPQSIETNMLKNSSVTEAKIGDFNLLAIEDYYSNNNNFEINSQKITNSTSNNLQVGTLGGFSGGFDVRAISFPFSYNENNQYRFLIIPQLVVTADSYMHITISESPTNSQQITVLNNNAPLHTKRYFKAGTYYNVVIPLFDFNYSLLTNSTTYYLSMYFLNSELNVTYNSIIKFNMTSTQSPNTPSNFITDMTALKMIQGYGAYAWNNLNGNSYPSLVPAVGLCVENPLVFNPPSTENTSKLRGKIINFMGDSITQGIDGSTNGNVASYPFPLIIHNKTGATCNNYGIAGSTIGGDGTTVSPITNAKIGFMPMCNRINNMNANADINVIWGGTNDAKADRRVDLGTIDDNTNLTFYGALNNICNTLLTLYPKKTNLLITPFKRQGQDNPNQYGYILEDYVKAVVEVGAKYGIPVFNFFDNMGGTLANNTWKQNNLPDGVHPNQDYYYTVADKIIDFISNNI